MPNVVGVRFKRAGKVYYFDPGDLNISPGNQVIVETARGVESGEVVVGPKPVGEDEVVAPLKKVVRVATEKDATEIEDNRRREREALALCAKKIAEHGLEMNLIDCEYTFDGSKIIFYFTAEGRVDFRELVRDLAATFRARIELRQIGVRDEAKMLGGLGPCGRCVCCSSFLGDFAPVSIKMAKEQNLSLNPTKISGLCGRLMCCLRYECERYGGGAKAGQPEGGAAEVAQPSEDDSLADFPLEEVDQPEPRPDGGRQKSEGESAESEEDRAASTEQAKPAGEERRRDKGQRQANQSHNHGQNQNQNHHQNHGQNRNQGQAQNHNHNQNHSQPRGQSQKPSPNEGSASSPDRDSDPEKP